MFFFVIPLAGHFRLEVVVVVANAHAFLHQLFVTDVALICALLLLDLPIGDLLPQSVDAVCQSFDVLAVLLVITKQFFVVTNLAISFG